MDDALVGKGLDTLSDDPLVVKYQKDWFHIHTYGQLTPFFHGLRAGRLLGTRCADPGCETRAWLPPRAHCPDCLRRTEWVELPQVGQIFTHTTIEYPGALFKLSTPRPLISVAIDGVCTKPMSYLLEGTPRIGMPVRAWFRTDGPTNTILDLAWVPTGG